MAARAVSVAEDPNTLTHNGAVRGEELTGGASPRPATPEIVGYGHGETEPVTLVPINVRSDGA